MDIEEIISGGLLELYVLGLTNADETRRVEEWRAQYPEVNAEIRQIEADVETYIRKYEKIPPAELREKILGRIGMRKPGAAPRLTFISRAATIAASIVLAASVIINIILYNRWTDSKSQLARLENEKQLLTEQMVAQNASMGQYKEELEILTRPTLKMVALRSVKPEVEALVTVYWDTAQNNVFVNINNLPPAPAGMQYQLWAIADGQPVDAGMMDSTNTLQRLKTIKAAQAFAITLEKEGGSPTPTLTQLVVLGNV